MRAFFRSLVCATALLVSTCGVSDALSSFRLAWDYAPAEEALIDQFVLQRRLGNGAYTDATATSVVVEKTLRATTDATVTPGTAYCFRLLAAKLQPAPDAPLLSPPSNEVCRTALQAPTRLRFP